MLQLLEHFAGTDGDWAIPEWITTYTELRNVLLFLNRALHGNSYAVLVPPTWEQHGFFGLVWKPFEVASHQKFSDYPHCTFTARGTVEVPIPLQQLPATFGAGSLYIDLNFSMLKAVVKTRVRGEDMSYRCSQGFKIVEAAAILNGYKRKLDEAARLEAQPAAVPPAISSGRREAASMAALPPSHEDSDGDPAASHAEPPVTSEPLLGVQETRAGDDEGLDAAGPECNACRHSDGAPEANISSGSSGGDALPAVTAATRPVKVGFAIAEAVPGHRRKRLSGKAPEETPTVASPQVKRVVDEADAVPPTSS